MIKPVKDNHQELTAIKLPSLCEVTTFTDRLENEKH
jgi:hypothetical protein